ncbi:hypothetical protein JT358_15855 [Micrococcales bacterium 31B]|nr:hypothetical protein [Micrococcales bacterium 31B]
MSTATACTDDAAPAATTGVASASVTASTSNASTPASKTTTIAPSSSITDTTTPATPDTAPATEDPQYVGTAAPGSTWTPPALTKEQVQENQKVREAGFGLEYVDPKIALAKPKRVVEKPFIEPKNLTKDDLGAIRIVDYYYDSIDYLYATGDPEPLKSVSSTTLLQFDQIYDQVQEWHRTKSFITNDAIFVEDLRVTDRGSNDITLRGRVSFPSVSAYTSTDSVRISLPDQSGTWEHHLVWHSDGLWIVDSVKKIDDAN